MLSAKQFNDVCIELHKQLPTAQQATESLIRLSAFRQTPSELAKAFAAMQLSLRHGPSPGAPNDRD